MIELLVVIAIIAILAAMLLPALTKAQKQAQSATCKNRLHQMGLALNMYLGDFHVFPRHYAPFSDNHSQNWSYFLRPYYHLAWTNRDFHCPAYRGLLTPGIDDGDSWGSYGYNAYAVSMQTAKSPRSLSLDGNHQLGGGPALAESGVLAPGEMFAIMDCRGYPGSPFAGSDGTHCSPWYERQSNSSPGTEVTTPFVSKPPQHGKSFNVLSCDGHVDSIRLTVLFNPTNTASNWNNDHQPHKEYWVE